MVEKGVQRNCINIDINVNYLNRIYEAILDLLLLMSIVSQ